MGHNTSLKVSNFTDNKEILAYYEIRQFITVSKNLSLVPLLKHINQVFTPFLLRSFLLYTSFPRPLTWIAQSL
jgi:hypothetical protein